VYKFQTNRGPDRDAAGVLGEGNGEGVSPSRLGDLGEHRSVFAENEFWRILKLEKTHMIDTNL